MDAIIRARRDSEARERIGLFNVRIEDNQTVIEPFELPGLLFKDQEILAALADRTESGVFESMVLRGLVDE